MKAIPPPAIPKVSAPRLQRVSAPKPLPAGQPVKVANVGTSTPVVKQNERDATNYGDGKGHWSGH